MGLLERLLPYKPLPGGQARLDAEWAEGKWDFLRSLDHLPRLGVVASYCDGLGAASVLEIGCGEGLLRKRLLTCKRYLGVDISSEAIKRAPEGPGARFVAVDASRFIPGERFDVIVFNECLEWFADPRGLLEHYQQFLLDEGVCIVSMCVDAQSKQVWRKLARLYRTHTRTQISNQAGDSWAIRILRRK